MWFRDTTMTMKRISGAGDVTIGGELRLLSETPAAVKSRSILRGTVHNQLRKWYQSQLCTSSQPRTETTASAQFSSWQTITWFEYIHQFLMVTYDHWFMCQQCELLWTMDESMRTAWWFTMLRLDHRRLRKTITWKCHLNYIESHAAALYVLVASRACWQHAPAPHIIGFYLQFKPE